jgi:hypothetical protein
MYFSLKGKNINVLVVPDRFKFSDKVPWVDFDP